jgi:hypothetical protein
MAEPSKAPLRGRRASIPQPTEATTAAPAEPQSAAPLQRKARRSRRKPPLGKRVPKLSGGQQKHFPTDATRKAVEDNASLGAPHEEIAVAIGIAKETLQRHYQPELDRGALLFRLRARRSLYSLVIGAPAVYDNNGRLAREEIKPDAASVRFFARCKLGFVEAFKVKSGPDLPDSLDDYDLTKLSENQLDALSTILEAARREQSPPAGNARSEAGGREGATRH